ncbi:MAG: hypothetical protein IPL64_02195 [Flavobacteriales bacterium]|nr:hypothetical protein [Flavobacteriales bacterium]MBK9626526.1 hypothetical protein [Flavobacteriales bacterium]MBP8878890.1 hypothetical protein [Flavobacteriales bacterium]
MTHDHIDTPVATVEYGDELVVVRFKAGVTLTVSGIVALLTARKRSVDRGPLPVLVLFPDDEMDFDLSMITTDHYKDHPVEGHSKALAWVTRNAHNDRFARLYFTYFPSPVPSAVFLEEAEARVWLRQVCG